MFGKRGEAVSNYVKKGTQVAISGEFQARPYTSKDGAEKLSLEVRVNDLTLLGGKPESQSNSQTAHKNIVTPVGDFDDMTDDIPF